jgi:hypothetical protein
MSIPYQGNMGDKFSPWQELQSLVQVILAQPVCENPGSRGLEPRWPQCFSFPTGGGSSRARNERPNRLVTHPATPPVMFRGPAHKAGEEQPSFPPSDGSGTKPNKHHLRLPPQQRTWAGAGRSVSFSLFCGRAQSREEKTRLGYRVSASLRVERDGAGGFLFLFLVVPLPPLSAGLLVLFGGEKRWCRAADSAVAFCLPLPPSLFPSPPWVRSALIKFPLRRGVCCYGRPYTASWWLRANELFKRLARNRTVPCSCSSRSRASAFCASVSSTS